MTTNTNSRAWWCGSVATFLALVPLGLARAPGAPAQASSKGIGAVKGANPQAKAAPAGPKLPARPPRRVVPPTLDAAGLDALLEKSVTEAQAPFAAHTTDEQFVRRVYLDIIGKPPTPEQVRAFVLTAPNRAKRAKLIDALLASSDYARNWARYWRDVIRFRATNEERQQIRYQELEDWLADRFAQNAPWDEIATQLIAGTGTNDTVGAVNFTLAHSAQPVEVAGEVSRIFLGVQIQCAQCHDHPNDPWKRVQFHEFASFFAGTRMRRTTPDQVRPEIFEVVAEGKPGYSMPDLKDPQKQIPVPPRFFLAASSQVIPNGLTTDQRRKLAASYITGQDNPWFSKAFVNRVLYVLMGESFYNPVDDLGPTRDAKAPEVIEVLASQWQQGGYDVKWLYRTILNTRSYQRASRSTLSEVGRAPFASNCAGRLRSDQIADALAQAINLPLAAPSPEASPAATAAKSADPKAAMGPPTNPRRTAFVTLFGVDPSTPNEEILGTIPQALYLMNDPQVNGAIRGDKGKILGDILAQTKDNRTVLEALYLRVLCRRPVPPEVELCGRYLTVVRNRREAFEDILWSLINSTEFVSRR